MYTPPNHARRLPVYLSVCGALFLAACSNDPEPGNEIHDTKYERSSDGCIEDSVTGLTWEAKSDEPGLHDWRNTYTWYDPNEAHHELDYRGTNGGGECSGSSCDTWALVIAVNTAGLCGYNDWRMPTRDELLSISDLRKAKTPPTVNVEYFPHAQAGEYWSANDYSFQPDAAWAWSFQFGHDRVDWKREPKFARVVRGEAFGLPEVKE